MKKLVITLIIALSFVAIAAPVATSAKDIKTISATYESGKIAVSGTAEAGTLAVAIMIYDEKGADLISMQTASVSNENLYYSEIELAEGNYVVKVADYDGGNYKTATVSAKAVIPDAPNSGAVK
ncbi:hypothetical protein IKG48_02650 [Candidatus Saccharibacteria bacterium]|nr:hypothetical protein [Candidatus Saccharibacteria bacterium]